MNKVDFLVNLTYVWRKVKHVENNYVYPDWHTHPHHRVKEMKRDVRRMERERKKELRIAARQVEKEKIRKELKQKGYDA